MEYLFMDEKGPQETFKILEPYDPINKLSYGNDDMHSYVANILIISKANYEKFELNYTELEKNYIGQRTQLSGKELKGKDIFINRFFRYGVASLTNERDLGFLEKFFKLLIDSDSKNLLFEVGKMSIIVDSRLNEWILTMSEKANVLTFQLKYTLTKYMETISSEPVVRAMLDKSIPLNRVLLLIKKNLEEIIENNINNPRMKSQLAAYKELIHLIDFTLDENIELIEPNIDAKFNWNKVSWPLDLTFLELDHLQSKNNDRIFFLDEGIPKETFEDLDFGELKEGLDSKEFAGLRVVDILVVMAGKYISNLHKDSRHDLKDLKKTHTIPEKWFEFSSRQFSILKQMKRFYFPYGRTFSVNIDTYFDDLWLFYSYIDYVSSYQSFGKFGLKSSFEHREGHFRLFSDQFQMKFEEAIISDQMAIEEFGSVRNAINEGVRKPL